MAETTAPQAIRREDYAPPAFTTRHVDLDVQLDPDATQVTATLTLERRGPGPLELDGEALELKGIELDGVRLGADRFRIDGERLVIGELPDRCRLTVHQTIRPAQNTSFTGLYVSNGIFCTQCEAQGFRRITWSQDRPDVMATYRVRLSADKAACPVLLANGNPVAQGDLPEGRHYAVWEDPFPKPSYLFALVAGDLAVLEDSFTTRSGRKVTLRIYSEHANIDQCRHAMDSLKRAMRWDEERYGLEYDLDLFMIVAVNDFNMGAMENKGLNIFNTAATLARQDTSTDADFVSVERIIAHEYFHNWTGNRITCRDWFQLTLKEGLTVFRDQQFTADMHSAAVKRIGDVVLLREGQFPEDAGPLAHPIRPDSYVAIDNFYTRTVYEKGAEVIRMIHTLVGEASFRKGMDLYVQRHDGQAVTCEDFVKAMEDASGRDLTQFRRWYGQAGTPRLKVTQAFDEATGKLTLTFEQTTPPTPGQPEKLPLHLPVRTALIDRQGRDLPLTLEGENEPRGTERVLEVTEARQSFTFTGLEAAPVPSVLRGFSAPVLLEVDEDDATLAFRFAHDSDPFNRWDAGQTLALRLILRAIEQRAQGHDVPLDPGLARAFRAIAKDSARDPAFAARALTLPGFAYVGEKLPVIDVEGIHTALDAMRRQLARELREVWAQLYESNRDRGAYSLEPAAMGRRALKNLALLYRARLADRDAVTIAERQFAQADNMTDSIAALRALLEAEAGSASRALAAFYERWQHEPLVVNKWFALQAAHEHGDALLRVERLRQHPAFTMSNPNRLRSLIAVFATQNPVGFHRRDGKGYAFLADRVIELDPKNPQVAARLLTPLGRWRRFDPARQKLMRQELERVARTPGLSRDTQEIATKSLA